MNFNPDSLYFLPLGGAAEIGMNATLYGYQNHWLIVDFGLNFADESAMPGIDILLPDISFLQSRREQILGIVLTHAHEDHFGAIPYLWSELQCKIYATGFALSLLDIKLQEIGHRRIPLQEVTPGQPFTLGPFALELIRVTHSIPESNLLAIRTDQGTVVHTGDWRFDPTPVIGQKTSEETLMKFRQENVLAMVCDSTNALETSFSGSESQVLERLTDVFSQFKDRRIAITCFASNVERIESIVLAGRKNNRHTALIGRSLWRINTVARKNGYFSSLPEFYTPEQAAHLEPGQTILVCTGSQGEKRSTLSRLAQGDHPFIQLDSGDVMIFSSRVIPGNEKDVSQIQNQLVSRGVDLITLEEDDLIHVSGHPSQEELRRLYDYIQPDLAIPVHGEPRHQKANALLAQSCGVPLTLIPTNGTVIRLTPEPPEIVDQLSLHPLAVDGKRLIPIHHDLFRARKQIGYSGGVLVSIGIKNKALYQTKVSLLGLLNEEQESLANVLNKTLSDLPEASLLNDDSIQKIAKSTIRKFLNHSQGKKPVIQIHIMRI